MGRDSLGFVYVLTNPAWPGLTKIGSASCAMRRLHTFQTGDPNRAYRLHAAIETPHWRRVERAAHRWLGSCRVEGTEWFRVHPDDAVLAIQHVLKEVKNGRAS